MPNIKIAKLKCRQCGHEWVPRTSDVRACPKCHSLRWDRPPRINERKD